MVVNKSKKVTKYRAHTTHGGGSRKKRRGAGSRGGRGNAGTGKRAGHKKAGSTFKLGSKGFTSLAKKTKSVNVGYFTENKINRLIKSGKITQEGDVYIVDMSKLGFEKLLGTGNTNLKLQITVTQFTASAEEKIKSVGGNIQTGKKEVIAEPKKE